MPQDFISLLYNKIKNRTGSYNFWDNTYKCTNFENRKRGKGYVYQDNKSKKANICGDRGGSGGVGTVGGDNSDSGENIVACGVRDEKRSAKTGVFERNGLGGV